MAALVAGCPGPPRHSAYDLLSDDPYRELLVEIDWAQGNAPDPSAVSLLATRIDERLAKPDGVEFSSSAFEAPGGSYSLADLRRLREREQDQQARGTTMVLHVFYLDGRFEDDPQVIGLSYDHAAIAVFKEALRDGLPPLASASVVERAVLVHEFGHSVGLVDNRIPMVRDHEDPNNLGHSKNRDSVMYYAVESLAALPLVENVPDQFDADDIADIRAAGGK